MQRFKQIKFFRKCLTESVHCPDFADVQDFFAVKIGFPENQVFQRACSILMEKLFLRVYNDESNVFQVLESNYIDYSCLY